MPSKSPELRAIEKQIKTERKNAQEVARRERASAIVHAAKYIDDFRVMNIEAEMMLRSALDKLLDSSSYVVTVEKETFDRNISDNFALICEELQQYGAITAYMLLTSFAQLTLSEAGKTYFEDKAKAETKAAEVGESLLYRDKIFISHRTIDAPIADMIKDFLVNTGIPNDKVFCSSLPGNDVNEKIAPEVKQKLKESLVNILILSKDYYQSAYCLNEAGVIWYLDDVVAIPIGLPEINHTSMVGFLNSDYKLRRLDSDDDISYIYDIIHEKLQTSGVKHSIITRETAKLKERYLQHIESRAVTEESDVNEGESTQRVSIEKDECVLLSYAAFTDGIIIVSESVMRTGASVEAGGYDFAAADTPRECARWKAAVKQLERYGLIENPKYDGKLYKVTKSGYEVAEQAKEKWKLDVNKSPIEYVEVN